MRGLLSRIFAVALALAIAVLAPPAIADSGQGLLLLLGGGAPSWVLPPARNGVDLWFAKGLYYLKGATGALTNTRASNETCVTSLGALVQVGSNQNCVTDLGVGKWEGRTNSLYNSTMAGAVVGTPGTLPLHWSIPIPAGLSQQVVSTATDSGLPAIQIRLFGTSTGTAFAMQLETTTQIAALYGQTWTGSVYSKMIANVYPANVSSFNVKVAERNSGGTTLNMAQANISLASGAVGLQRTAVSYTLPDVTAAFVGLRVDGVITSGVPIDITIELAAPQLELNNTPASVASATVATGGTCTPGSNITWTIPTVNGGTAATVTGTVTGTTLSGALTVTGAGSYTVDATHGLPASPVTVTGGTCTTQPTINLVPVDNAAAGFATPPILTTNGAQARTADSISLPVTACTSLASLYGVATPGSPVATADQPVASLNNGSTVNSLTIKRLFMSPKSAADELSSSNFYRAGPSPAWPQGVSGKITATSISGTLNAAFNTANTATASPIGFPSGMNKLQIGTDQYGNIFNGTISRVAEVCNQSLLNQ